MIKLINKDCMTDPIPEHNVLITDPPFSAHVHAKTMACAAHGAQKGVRQRDLGFAPLSPELRNHICRAAAVSHRWIVIYSDIEGVAGWCQSLRRYIRSVPIVALGDEEAEGGGVVGDMPWLRWSMPQLSGDRPPSTCDMLVLSHGPGRLRWGGPGNLMALQHKCERGLDKHPAAKPLDQALDLVAWFSSPGETIYDPCAGRGTLGVACALLARGYVGYESDVDHAQRGQARIEDARRAKLGPTDSARYERWARALGVTPEPRTYWAPVFRRGVPYDA